MRHVAWFVEDGEGEKAGAVIHSNDYRRLLLPVDALDVSIYESTYLADDVVIP